MTTQMAPERLVRLEVETHDHEENDREDENGGGHKFARVLDRASQVAEQELDAGLFSLLPPETFFQIAAFLFVSEVNVLRQCSHALRDMVDDLPQIWDEICFEDLQWDRHSDLSNLIANMSCQRRFQHHVKSVRGDVGIGTQELYELLAGLQVNLTELLEFQPHSQKDRERLPGDTGSLADEDSSQSESGPSRGAGDSGSNSSSDGNEASSQPESTAPVELAPAPIEVVPLGNHLQMLTYLDMELDYLPDAVINSMLTCTMPDGTRTVLPWLPHVTTLFIGAPSTDAIFRLVDPAALVTLDFAARFMPFVDTSGVPPLWTALAANATRFTALEAATFRLPKGSFCCDPLPVSCLAGVPHLKKLFLDNVWLKDFHLHGCTSLEVLHVTWNAHRIPMDGLRGLTNLKTLKLRGWLSYDVEPEVVDQAAGPDVVLVPELHGHELTRRQGIIGRKCDRCSTTSTPAFYQCTPCEADFCLACFAVARPDEGVTRDELSAPDVVPASVAAPAVRTETDKLAAWTIADVLHAVEHLIIDDHAACNTSVSRFWQEFGTSYFPLPNLHTLVVGSVLVPDFHAIMDNLNRMPKLEYMGLTLAHNQPNPRGKVEFKITPLAWSRLMQLEDLQLDVEHYDTRVLVPFDVACFEGDEVKIAEIEHDLGTTTVTITIVDYDKSRPSELAGY